MSYAPQMNSIRKSQEQFVRVNESDRLQLITWTISRPDRCNAIGTTIAAELNHLAKSLKAQMSEHICAIGCRHPRVLLLTTQGPQKIRKPKRATSKKSQKIWIAGGDLKELSTLDASSAKTYAKDMTSFCDILGELPLIVIVAVDGASIGGAVEIIAAADIRLATVASTFEMRQLRVGLPTGYGGTRRLLQIIGKSELQRLVFLGEKITAKAAASMGLVHKLFRNDHAILTYTEALAAELAALSPSAIATQKRMIIASNTLNPGAIAAQELEDFVGEWRNPWHEQALEKFNQS